MVALLANMLASMRHMTSGWGWGSWRTETPETTITKLVTGIVHHEYTPLTI